MSVWIHECPADIHAVDAIAVLEQDCSHTDHAEAVLQQIVAEHPYWPEPRSRLALLWMVQGRYGEADAAVQTVLQQKPWHFEALHMQVFLKLVMVVAGESHHSSSSSSSWVQALPYARRELPPLEQPRRRDRWVDRAVQQAYQHLAQREGRAEQARGIVAAGTLLDNDRSVWQ